MVGINAKFSNLFKNEEFVGPFSTIKNLWLCNVNRVVIGNLNIDSQPIKLQHVLLRKFTIFLKFKFQKKIQYGITFF